MDQDKDTLLEISRKLDASISASQYLFILHAKQIGLKQEDVRKLLKINNNKLSQIWKLIKI